MVTPFGVTREKMTLKELGSPCIVSCCLRLALEVFFLQRQRTRENLSPKMHLWESVVGSLVSLARSVVSGPPVSIAAGLVTVVDSGTGAHGMTHFALDGVTLDTASLLDLAHALAANFAARVVISSSKSSIIVSA
jgi:hypothetical protein